MVTPEQVKRSRLAQMGHLPIAKPTPKPKGNPNGNPSPQEEVPVKLAVDRLVEPETREWTAEDQGFLEALLGEKEALVLSADLSAGGQWDVAAGLAMQASRDPVTETLGTLAEPEAQEVRRFTTETVEPVMAVDALVALLLDQQPYKLFKRAIQVGLEEMNHLLVFMATLRGGPIDIPSERVEYLVARSKLRAHDTIQGCKDTGRALLEKRPLAGMVRLSSRGSGDLSLPTPNLLSTAQAMAQTGDPLLMAADVTILPTMFPATPTGGRGVTLRLAERLGPSFSRFVEANSGVIGRVFGGWFKAGRSFDIQSPLVRESALRWARELDLTLGPDARIWGGNAVTRFALTMLRHPGTPPSAYRDIGNIIGLQALPISPGEPGRLSPGALQLATHGVYTASARGVDYAASIERLVGASLEARARGIATTEETIDFAHWKDLPPESARLVVIARRLSRGRSREVLIRNEREVARDLLAIGSRRYAVATASGYSLEAFYTPGAAVRGLPVAVDRAYRALLGKMTWAQTQALAEAEILLERDPVKRSILRTVFIRSQMARQIQSLRERGVEIPQEIDDIARLADDQYNVFLWRGDFAAAEGVIPFARRQIDNRVLRQGQPAGIITRELATELDPALWAMEKKIIDMRRGGITDIRTPAAVGAMTAAGLVAITGWQMMRAKEVVDEAPEELKPQVTEAVGYWVVAPPAFALETLIAAAPEELGPEEALAEIQEAYSLVLAAIMNIYAAIDTADRPTIELAQTVLERAEQEWGRTVRGRFSDLTRTGQDLVNNLSTSFGLMAEAVEARAAEALVGRREEILPDEIVSTLTRLRGIQERMDRVANAIELGTEPARGDIVTVEEVEAVEVGFHVMRSLVESLRIWRAILIRRAARQAERLGALRARLARPPAVRVEERR